MMHQIRTTFNPILILVLCTLSISGCWSKKKAEIIRECSEHFFDRTEITADSNSERAKAFRSYWYAEILSACEVKADLYLEGYDVNLEVSDEDWDHHISQGEDALREHELERLACQRDVLSCTEESVSKINRKRHWEEIRWPLLVLAIAFFVGIRTYQLEGSAGNESLRRRKSISAGLIPPLSAGALYGTTKIVWSLIDFKAANAYMGFVFFLLGPASGLIVAYELILFYTFLLKKVGIDFKNF